ncbi:tRNA (guanine10-N2)-methyltransferase, partial [Mytilus galloprovincialis]
MLSFPSACDNGYFGNKCANRCYCLTEPCSKGDGICQPIGCNEGWYGDSCNKECKSGYFGRNCGEFCGGCISSICDKLDGLCKNITGCNPGYLYEEYCNITCEDGYFGDNCTLKCNCMTGTCNSLTGKCFGDESESLSTETPNAAAIGGGVAAFIIAMLIIVAACVFYKRRLISTQKGAKTTSSDTTAYETRNSTNNSHQNEQQYEDLIRMDPTSPYQELTTPSVSNEYEQIDNTFSLPEDIFSFKGKVNLKNPDNTFGLLEYYGANKTEPPDKPFKIYFGRLIADGQRDLIQQFHLTKRHFIGNTSMDAGLSLIMSNLAQVKQNSVVFDPFVGT